MFLKVENAKLLSNKYDKLFFKIDETLYNKIQTHADAQKLPVTAKVLSDGTYTMSCHYASESEILKLKYMGKSLLEPGATYKGVLSLTTWTYNSTNGVKLVFYSAEKVEEKVAEVNDEDTINSILNCFSS